MKNGDFFKTVFDMHDVPRWDEYAPHFQDNPANHSFRCAVYALFAALVEEIKFGNKIDKTKVVAGALLHDLNETITGSIKHNTKKDSTVEEHINLLEKEASEEIVGYLSKSLQPYFYDYIVNAEDDSYEGRIVDAIDTFDAMIYLYRETQFGSNPYLKYEFDKIYKELKSCDIPSIKWLVEQFDLKNNFFEFMYSTLKLDKINRWSRKLNIIKDNDASHSFRVASWGLFNAIIEKEKYGYKEADLFKVLGKCLFHDLVEEITGDVNGPLKHSSPERKRAFAAYEKKVSIQMVESIPEFMKEEIYELMVNAKSNDYEGRMVEIADKMDALIKSNMEMKINRYGYSETFRNQLEKFQHNFEDKCVMFFLAYILHDLTFGPPLR